MTVRLRTSTVQKVLADMYGLDFSDRSEAFARFEAIFVKTHTDLKQIARIDINTSRNHWLLEFWSFNESKGFKKLISFSAALDFGKPLSWE